MQAKKNTLNSGSKVLQNMIQPKGFEKMTQKDFSEGINTKKRTQNLPEPKLLTV